MVGSDFIQYGPKEDMPKLDVPLAQYLLDKLISHGDKVAQVLEGEGERTFSDILRYSRGVTRVLQEYGIGRGDTVMVACGITLDFAPIFVGILTVGANCCPVIPTYEPGDFKYLLQVCQPRLLLCDKKSLKNMQEAAGAQSPRIVPLAMLRRRYNDPENEKPIAPVPLDDPTNHVALVMTSSGTTGRPKGVEITQGTLHYMALRNAFPSGTVALCPFAAFWVTGFGGNFVGMTSGTKVIHLDNFTAKNFCQAVQNHKVTFAAIGVQFLMTLVRFENIKDFDLSSLRMVGCGGTKATDEQLEAGRRQLGVNVTPTYGMTEAIRTMKPAFRRPDKTGSVGTPDTNYVVKVVDIETEEVLGPNTLGELRFIGPSTLKCYRGDSQATRQLFDEDGFLKSGDLGYYDDEGYFFIVDRIKDHIKYKMTQQPCIEIESAVLQHPDVLEVAVVGIPHDEDTERSTAYIVKMADSEVTGYQIQEFVKEKLCEMKWLHGGVYFINELPKTMTGKVKKNVLRSQHASHRGTVNQA